MHDLIDWENDRGEPTAETYTVEFFDGSSQTYRCDYRSIQRELDRLGNLGLEVVSAWRDDEPWFGRCTRSTDC